MMEKSEIEILREFAEATNRSLVEKEIPYPLTGIRTFQKYKSMVYIPNNSENRSFYIWFSDPYAQIGVPTIFSGAFIPLSSKIESKINIRNRNILDRLSLFSKTENNAIGNARFDSKVVISGTVDNSIRILLSQSNIQEQLLNALTIKKFITISLNEYKIDFVPELKDSAYLAIINPHSWDLESDDIEKIFGQIEKIRDEIK